MGSDIILEHAFTFFWQMAGIDLTDNGIPKLALELDDRHIDRRIISPMAVDDQDLFKTMVGQTSANIDGDLDQRFRLKGEGPRKDKVIQRDRVFDDRGHQYLAFPGRPLSNILCDDGVGCQGKMRTVLFN